MSTTPDGEHVLDLARSEEWAAAWEQLHEAAPALDADDRLAWAAATLTDATMQRVEEKAVTADLADALERLVLMHSGGLYHVSGERFQTAIARLVAFHHADGDLDTARRYARFCPSEPACAAVLDDDPDRSAGVQSPPDADAGDAVPDALSRRTLDHDAEDRVQVTVTDPATSADRTIGLFRSPLEKAFFHAVRDVFPTFTPYPNVALKSVVDVDTMTPYLSGAERSYLYTGLIDCVLFDAQDDFRPVAFFELDSRHHDAPDRKQKDVHKDRILAIAGHRLYRIRPHADVDREDLVQLLRSLPVELATSS